MERREKIRLTEPEKNVIIKALVELRNGLIREGRYTDAVDDLLLRFLK